MARGFGARESGSIGNKPAAKMSYEDKYKASLDEKRSKESESLAREIGVSKEAMKEALTAAGGWFKYSVDGNEKFLNELQEKVAMGKASEGEKLSAEIGRAIASAWDEGSVDLDVDQNDAVSDAEEALKDGAIYGDSWHDGPGSGKFEGFDVSAHYGTTEAGKINLRGKEYAVVAHWKSDIDSDEDGGWRTSVGVRAVTLRPLK